MSRTIIGHAPDLSKFDPNNHADKPWATYIPTRRGADFRVHQKRGVALSALSYHSCGIVYQHDGEKWVEVVRRDPHTAPDRCENCNLQGVPAASRSAAYGTTKRALFGVLRRGTGRKLAEPLEMLWVCEACVGVVG